MGLVIAWKVCEVINKHILNQKSRLNQKKIKEQVKRVVEQVSQTDRFALYLVYLLFAVVGVAVGIFGYYKG
ncbi:uncharacterized protein G2W53_014475 [Senna tora]|uniref:Uncharacterized protein n=1 Tax=Senna tora TaxID=362788 RepID=A0A835C850_9FABA|nr:uncharacterized protein G2W53_014475 [Senna tora]